MKLSGQNTELIEKLTQAAQVRKITDLSDITKSQIAQLTEQLEMATQKLANLNSIKVSYSNAPSVTVNTSKPKREKANLVTVEGSYKPKTGIRLQQGSQNELCYKFVNENSKDVAISLMANLLEMRSPDRDKAWYLARSKKYVTMAINGSLGQV